MWSRKSKVNTTSSVSTLPLWPLAKILSKVKCIMQISGENLSLFSPTTCTKWGGKLWYLIIFTLIVEPSRTWLSWKDKWHPKKVWGCSHSRRGFLLPIDGTAEWWRKIPSACRWRLVKLAANFLPSGHTPAWVHGPLEVWWTETQHSNTLSIKSESTELNFCLSENTVIWAM